MCALGGGWGGGGGNASIATFNLCEKKENLFNSISEIKHLSLCDKFF